MTNNQQNQRHYKIQSNRAAKHLREGFIPLLDSFAQVAYSRSKEITEGIVARSSPRNLVLLKA